MTSVSVRAVWERRGFKGNFLWLLLLPASFLFRFLVQFRNLLFTWGLLKSARLPRPVVSVGNLTVGGTGKTPTCIWLAQELNKRGLRVGILSRGYRRRESGPVVVSPSVNGMINGATDDELLKGGDEPLMMARLYNQTVGVAEDRGEAARALLKTTDVDVFVLDDGFQHRSVRRDFDLLLLGHDFTGTLLPAGPFREPKKNLRRANGLLITGNSDNWNTFLAKKAPAPSFSGRLEAVALIGFGANQWKEFPLGLLCQRKILTVTGIGDPRALYEIIHQWEGELIDTLEFPDHHVYTSRDWQQINRMARLVDLIITTEKDILKLIRFPFAKDKLMALRVVMTVDNGAALVDAIGAKVKQVGGASGVTS